jgi:hypothetical protein
MLARLDEAISALDQPTMDGVNTYFVSWAARQVGLKVALSGIGGDELFAGYSTFPDTPRLAHLETLSRFVPAAFRRISTPLICNLLGKQSSRRLPQSGDAWRMPNALQHPYFFTRLLFPPSDLLRLTEPRFRKSTIAADGVTLEPTWLAWLERIADQSREFEPVAAISWLELRTYMGSTLLRDTDSVSMARSLEVRVPLLDTPLVEFMCALPDEARVRPETPKALLRAALEDLPSETFNKISAPSPSGKTGCAPLSAPLRRKPKLAPPAPHLHSAGVEMVWDNFLHACTRSCPWSPRPKRMVAAICLDPVNRCGRQRFGSVHAFLASRFTLITQQTVGTSGCLSSPSIDDNVSSGTQDSLLYSRVETVLVGEIADTPKGYDQLPTEDSLIARFGQPHYRSAGYSESCEARSCRDSSRQRHIRCCAEDHAGAHPTERICGGYARSWPQTDGPRD